MPNRPEKPRSFTVTDLFIPLCTANAPGEATRSREGRGSIGPPGFVCCAGLNQAFPIQADKHFLTLLRYVERNALQAGLVERAEAWRPLFLGKSSSLASRSLPTPPTILAPSPLKLPRNWKQLVNRPQTAAEVQAVRRSIERGTPLGGDRWTRTTAERLGLEHTLRPRGRPRKTPEK